jgi:Flp pilus assembly pilin Flp
MKDLLMQLHNDEDGATATEYIILLILIACFVIAIVKLFGTTVSSKFGSAQESVQSQVSF